MQTTTQTLTATEARQFAEEIKTKCSECFPADKVVARKFLGKWVIDINGGSGACYGKTVRSADAAEDLIRIFQN